MIDLHDTIDTIKRHPADGSDRSLTYAALECRLAIERICYDRLARAHDYVSHEEVRRWQPHLVIKLVEEDIDPYVASTYTLGSGLVDHSQKMTVAARAMAAKKTVGQRS